jgi:transferase family hexapeptide repeat protein
MVRSQWLLEACLGNRARDLRAVTTTHPNEANVRRCGIEYALTVSIGDSVWLGGRAIVCPGVTIGANTAVGAGSVVTRNLPRQTLSLPAVPVASYGSSEATRPRANRRRRVFVYGPRRTRGPDCARGHATALTKEAWNQRVIS